MARCSNVSIQSCCSNRAAAAKSVPRGSVMVGICDASLLFRQAGEALQPLDAGGAERLVSAMMCACDTGTKSGAPR